MTSTAKIWRSSQPRFLRLLKPQADQYCPYSPQSSACAAFTGALFLARRRGHPLLAQHVDPFDPGTLIDIFKIEGNAVLMGTDAIRDGVDIPGDALRMILFDRVPWSVPDLVHKSRRKHFGKSFDDRLARRKLRQAYGRLIRRRDDFGLFIILDSRTPTRLFSSFPPGVEPLRMGLADAITFAEEFYAARI